jgi:hypothetical protein
MRATPATYVEADIAHTLLQQSNPGTKCVKHALHANLPATAAGLLLYRLELVPMTIGGLAADMVVALGAGAVSRLTVRKEDASMAAFCIIALSVGVFMIFLRGSTIDLRFRFLDPLAMALEIFQQGQADWAHRRPLLDVGQTQATALISTSPHCK